MHWLGKDRYIIGASRNLSTGSENSIKSDFEHVERLETGDSQLGSKFRRSRVKVQKHWLRFWCCYVLASVVFLAIFLPIL